MRKLIYLIFGLLFCGCATIAQGIQGAGRGLQENSKRHVDCTTYGGQGSYYTSCD